MAGVLALLVALFVAPPVRADGDNDKYQQSEMVTELKRQLRLLRQKRDLDEIERKAMMLRLDRIEEQLARLTDQSTSRRSNAFDPNPRTGTIRIQNDLYVPATVTIDGVPYVVRPRRTRTLTARPAGSVRYSVTADGFGVGPLNRSVVPADDTLKITVFDTRRDLDE
jgi:hypothetical protein